MPLEKKFDHSSITYTTPMLIPRIFFSNFCGGINTALISHQKYKCTFILCNSCMKAALL